MSNGFAYTLSGFGRISGFWKKNWQEGFCFFSADFSEIFSSKKESLLNVSVYLIAFEIILYSYFSALFAK
jgi:hypothetical protein